MIEDNSLTKGKILPAIIKISLPIMGTSFMQMAYNLINMIWIGKKGSLAVAAIGAAGFYTWLSMAFFRLSTAGAEVGVAQSAGRKSPVDVEGFARNAIFFNFVISVLYGLLTFLLRNNLIYFFKMEDASVNHMAIDYLAYICPGMIFIFFNPVISGVYNASGQTRIPFIFNSIGLVLNAILDPLLIFGIGPFPELSIKGAAIATVISQLIVSILFIAHFKSKASPIQGFKFFNKKPQFSYIWEIIKFGAPVGLQSALFTSFGIVLGRIISSWGPTPIAVQKVGSQIEAISYITAQGIATALSAFTGQNFGAGKWKRIWRGYFTTMGIITVIGILTSLILIFCARSIFAIFIREEEAVREGILYLKILGLSQLFMCIEIASTGAFNGLGKTVPPSIVSIVFTGLRVPAAMILSQPSVLGLNGVWWSISMSSVVKGVLIVIWFLAMLRNHPVAQKYQSSVGLRRHSNKKASNL